MPLELGHFFRCDLLDGLVDLVEVGHLGFDAHLLDCTAVAAAERVDAVQGLYVEILGDAHLHHVCGFLWVVKDLHPSSR